MSHKKPDIDSAIKTAEERASKTNEEAAKSFLAEVDRLRQNVVLTIVDGGTLDVGTVENLKLRVRFILEQWQTKFERIMSENQRRMFIRGIQVIDAAIAGAKIRQAVPYLGETRLQQIQKFGAELVTGITEDARLKITNELNLAMLGQKPMNEVVNAIGSNLEGASVFGTVARRSLVIMRTEGNRINQLGAVERMKQVSGQIPDMKKRWQHSHSGQPRLGHLQLDGTVIGAKEKFRLLGDDEMIYMVDAPYDLILPASETVNCRCKIIPVVGRFEKGSDYPDSYNPKLIQVG